MNAPVSIPLPPGLLTEVLLCECRRMGCVASALLAWQPCLAEQWAIQTEIDALEVSIGEGRDPESLSARLGAVRQRVRRLEEHPFLLAWPAAPDIALLERLVRHRAEARPSTPPKETASALAFLRGLLPGLAGPEEFARASEIILRALEECPVPEPLMEGGRADE